MTKAFRAACLAMIITLCVPVNAGATSRIKDLANVEGVRQNQLIGYGLVVGLNGTGDTLNNIPFTKQSLTAMLERLGVNIRGQTIRTGNVAAVMVTANLPAFGTQGTRIDVTVSAMGDAKSLQGGTLLVTPLLAADGNVFVDLGGAIVTGHPGGSLNEALTVYAIVNAVTANLPDTAAVQILVDGKQVDTLAGHIDLRYPLGKALEWVKKGQ